MAPPVRAADILMLTVPFEGQAALLKQLKPAIPEGSIVIDATVPLAPALADAPRALWVSGRAPPHNRLPNLCPKGVSVVAAFHNVSADILNGDDHSIAM